MIMIGFTETMYVSLLRKPIELYHCTTYFAVFLIFLQIFTNVMETKIVCGVDKLINNWSLYKESTRPKLTLYLQRVANMVAYILRWQAIIFISKVFV